VSEAKREELPESITVVMDAVDDLKAIDPLVLDLREVASFTDYLVMCTGSSDRHVQAVADGIREKLRIAGVTPLHTEGYEQASWVLVDYVDFLVNVFTSEARDFYQLDRVWRDAPVLVGERPESSPRGDESPEDGGRAAADDPDD
jgi:ribosome-associated protein